MKRFWLFLIFIGLVRCAEAQDFGYTLETQISAEEKMGWYIQFRDNSQLWRAIQNQCPGCYQGYEYMRKNSYWEYYGLGININPGYNLVFWPESTYAMVTDSDGVDYISTEWIVTRNRQKNVYISSLINSPLLVDRGMFDSNDHGHTVVWFRFNWDRPPDIVNWQLFGVKPRRLYR